MYNKNSKQDIVDPLSLSTNAEIYSNKINKTLKTGFENISLDYLDNRERRVRALNQLPVIKNKNNKINKFKNKNIKVKNRHIRYKCPICGTYKIINRKIRLNYNKLCYACATKIKYNFPAHLFLNLYFYNKELKDFLVPDLLSIDKELEEYNQTKVLILNNLIELNKQAKDNLTLELTDKIVKLKSRLSFINDSIDLTKKSVVTILSDKIKLYFKSYIQDKIKYYSERYNYRVLKILRLKLNKMSSDTLNNLSIDINRTIDYKTELIISDDFIITDKIYERFKIINYYKIINLILSGLLNKIDFLNLNFESNSRLYSHGLINKQYYYGAWDNLSKQPRAKFKKLKLNLVNNKNFKLSLYSSKIKFKELYTLKLKILNNDLKDLNNLLYNFDHGDIIKIRPGLETDKIHYFNKSNLEAINNLHKIFIEDIDKFISILSNNLAETIYNAYYNDKNRYNLFDYKIIPINNYIENIKYRVVRAMIKKNKKT